LVRQVEPQAWRDLSSAEGAVEEDRFGARKIEADLDAEPWVGVIEAKLGPAARGALKHIDQAVPTILLPGFFQGARQISIDANAVVFDFDDDGIVFVM
ncbi:MAG: hypothetical protein N2690_06490, partial [Rhodocyclaceae bacterium]|nr:hypothetical protein [Rhodocyclaceae bacterium]